MHGSEMVLRSTKLAVELHIELHHRARVLGLTTTLQLVPQEYRNWTIVARHMPRDSHPE
jgi:hypothetical protein